MESRAVEDPVTGRVIDMICERPDIPSDLYCSNGYATDELGCQRCACNGT